MQDPIVEEVRRIREAHAAAFNYDIDAIYADLKRLEANSSVPHVALAPRRAPTTEASAWTPSTVAD